MAEGCGSQPTAGPALDISGWPSSTSVEAGAQPMHSVCGRYTITFNGEIYNYRALRDELEARGHASAPGRTPRCCCSSMPLAARDGGAGCAACSLSRSATRDARACCSRAIRSASSRSISADDGWTLRFASQVKALLAGGAVSRDLDPAGRWASTCSERAGAVHDPARGAGAPCGHHALRRSAGPGAPRRYFSVAECTGRARRPTPQRCPRARACAGASPARLGAPPSGRRRDGRRCSSRPASTPAPCSA